MGAAIEGVPEVTKFGDGIFGRIHREAVVIIGGGDDIFRASFLDQRRPFARVETFAGEQRHELVVGEIFAPDALVIFLTWAAFIENIVAIPFSVLTFLRPAGNGINAPDDEHAELGLVEPRRNFPLVNSAERRRVVGLCPAGGLKQKRGQDERV